MEQRSLGKMIESKFRLEPSRGWIAAALRKNGNKEIESSKYEQIKKIILGGKKIWYTKDIRD